MDRPSATAAEKVTFGGFEFQLARRELRDKHGSHVELRPRSSAVLQLLASNIGQLVSKNEFMDRVWEDATVTEDSLTQCIAHIRRALGDDERQLIRTIPRYGYMLIPSDIAGQQSHPAGSVPGFPAPLTQVAKSLFA